jgi:hypothetical protein
MKKEIRTVDKAKQILQVTTVDERWYVRDMVDPETGMPKYEFVPSVTWICDHYPKGVAFYKWLASKGWDESQAIKTAAGDKGSKVHYAIRDLIEGKAVMIDAKYKNNSTGEEEELSFEEYDCIMAFVLWHKEAKPKFIAWEFSVWGDGYAGTVDLLCEIDGHLYLVDFKTSQSIWPSMEIQVSAYKHALEDQAAAVGAKLAILQVGYRLNKKRYKFTEVEDHFNEFLAAKVIWAKETKGVQPHQKDYPLRVRLDLGEKTHEATAPRKN